MLNLFFRIQKGPLSINAFLVPIFTTRFTKKIINLELIRIKKTSIIGCFGVLFEVLGTPQYKA
jgi:hypothetical protein